MRKKISIAIDGPAAAGKSTVAKMIAKELSYIYIDTGAMYRTLTYKALKNDINIENEEQLVQLLNATDIQLSHQKVLMDGEDVTDKIRSNEVTRNVSAVSKHKGVRQEMVRRQQEMGQKGGVVMDGRDIGTHVLPHAEVKIFLLASVEERAKRRHAENIQKNIPSDFEQIKKDIAYRDKLDSEREVAPLQKARDAIELDTTHLTIEEVASEILRIVKERIE
ncbi:MAG TPA: (d)CMP kinase [Bacillus sp. (in: firmicutes)]|uniref:(d)CMP kinase n=1 Tax=Bacillus litorisediminis TaxID=2922713 RepID=UPI001FAC1A6F|nr:(d)CMP kinase [Bacillus litorisediminis]HWO75847.1 (d)CMP kinase [Bacillus sp. (in: firmicutes)]